MNAPRRRLWEFQGFTICRLLGLAFDEKEMAKICRKFELKNGQQPLTASEMHGTLVQMCANPNPVSKYVDKLLREQFEPYQRRVEGLEQRDIRGLIERPDGPKDIPLPTLIWLAVRNQHEELDKIEAEVFNTIHLREHQALRFYDGLSRVLPDGKPENVLQELNRAVAAKQELEQKHKRSEQKREELRSDIEAIKREKSELALALAEQRRANEGLRKDLEKLGGESALERIESLKREKQLLSQEVKALTGELLKQELCRTSLKLSEPATHQRGKVEFKSAAAGDTDKEMARPLSLEGTRVAFVGGLDSLVPHYQEMVECLGGVFCNHCAGCQGRREAEDLVSGADVVFCPVNMNSHNACRYVKRACKLTGKPCRFLRSPSLSMFRRELVDFATTLN